MTPAEERVPPSRAPPSAFTGTASRLPPGTCAPRTGTLGSSLLNNSCLSLDLPPGGGGLLPSWLAPLAWMPCVSLARVLQRVLSQLVVGSDIKYSNGSATRRRGAVFNTNCIPFHVNELCKTATPGKKSSMAACWLWGPPPFGVAVFFAGTFGAAALGPPPSPHALVLGNVSTAIGRTIFQVWE